MYYQRSQKNNEDPLQYVHNRDQDLKFLGEKYKKIKQKTTFASVFVALGYMDLVGIFTRFLDKFVAQLLGSFLRNLYREPITEFMAQNACWSFCQSFIYTYKYKLAGTPNEINVTFLFDFYKTKCTHTIFFNYFKICWDSSTYSSVFYPMDFFQKYALKTS